MCIRTVQSGSRAFQHLDTLNGVHVDALRQSYSATCSQAVGVHSNTINKKNNFIRAVNVEFIGVIVLSICGAVRNNYAGDISDGLRNIVIMLLRNLIRSHDRYIRIRIDLLLRCTARSNDHLV